MSLNNYGLPSPLTAQTIFDKVAAHLIRQGKAAYDPADDLCSYRGPNGTACAVGCLISATQYQVAFEGKSAKQVAGAVEEQFLQIKQPILDLQPFAALLEGLQSVHDCWDLDAGADVIMAPLRRVANRFGLSAKLLRQGQPWSPPLAVEQTLPEEITRLLGNEVVVS